jgi:hypothetical protein
MNRRGFMAGILAAGFAPAAIGSGILMPVRSLGTFRHFAGHFTSDIRFCTVPYDFVVDREMTLGEIASWARNVVIVDGGRITVEARDTLLLDSLTKYHTYAEAHRPRLAPMSPRFATA